MKIKGYSSFVAFIRNCKVRCYASSAKGKRPEAEGGLKRPDLFLLPGNQMVLTPQEEKSDIAEVLAMLEFMGG